MSKDNQDNTKYTQLLETLRTEASSNNRFELSENALQAAYLLQFLESEAFGIEGEDNIGRTPLMYVTQLGYSQALKHLINAGVDLTKRYDNGRNILELSIHESNYGAEFNQVLIDARVDINAKDNDGKTPLMYAARSYRCRDVVDSLCAQGAEVNAKDNRGNTAFMYAAEIGNQDVMLLLKDKGADLNGQNNDGETPLMLAAKSKLSLTVEWLLKEGAKIDLKDNSGKTLLMRVAESGDIEMSRYLLWNHGVSIKDLCDKQDSKDAPLKLKSEYAQVPGLQKCLTEYQYIRRKQGKSMQQVASPHTNNTFPVGLVNEFLSPADADNLEKALKVSAKITRALDNKAKKSALSHWTSQPMVLKERWVEMLRGGRRDVTGARQKL